jgi:transposase
MRTKGSAEELERKRRRAVDLLEQGEKPADVIRILGVSPGALKLWRRAVREGGPDALAAKPRHVPKRLDETQLRQLAEELRKGSVAHGWANELWTGTRVATLIQRCFGVTYTPDHVRVLLRETLRWTSQKPERRGRERNEEEIERWRAEEFPRIKKKPKSAARISSSSTKPASCPRRSPAGLSRHGERRQSRNAGRATAGFR